MTFLIDGYNLMFAAGYATPNMAAARFERGRGRFLDWLAEHVGRRPAALRVVFDGQRAVGPSAEHDHKGLRVLFAYRETADDLIEVLVAAEPRPAALTVVSNDRRLQDAARHKGCPVRGCEAFMDWLLAYDAVPKAAGPPGPEKPDGPGPGEVEELLRAFDQPPTPKRPR